MECRAAPGKNRLVILILVFLGISFVIFLVTRLSVLDPQGLGWTMAMVGAGMAAGTAAFFLFKRAGQYGVTTLFGRKDR